MSEYHESLSYLERLYREPIIPSAKVELRRIHYLLEALGNPERSFRSVHVAGSCGKGSTVTMIGSVLREAGFRTALFRSPHLVDYRERIAVDGTDIGEDAWVRHWDLVRPVIDELRNNRELGRPAFFEVMFALGCLHFAEQEVEWAAVETGLGGRLDATNALEPDVAVITNVSLEHTQVLGNSVEAIAVEKAAIIKRGAHAVVGTRDQRVIDVVTRRAVDQNVPLRHAADVKLLVLDEDWHGQTLDVERAGTIRLPLAGQFQIENVSSAIAACAALRERRVQISNEALAAGLEGAALPGRMQFLDSHPPILLDGAHNPAAMAHLARAIGRLSAAKRTVMVFAALTDKNVNAMVENVAGHVQTVVVTRAPGTPRAAEPGDLATAFRRAGIDVMAVDDPTAALEAARELASEEDLIVVAGSMYLIGDAIGRLGSKSLVGAIEE